jgi:glycosyltransferase involved in cell wall biosynthesis
MRVVIDLQAFLPSGVFPDFINHYSVSLATAILEHDYGNRARLLINHSSDELLEKLQSRFTRLFANTFRASRLPFLDSVKFDSRWHRLAAELLREQSILQLKPDVVLCMPLISGDSGLVCETRYSNFPTAVALPEFLVSTGKQTDPRLATAVTESSLEKSVDLERRWQAELVFTASEYCKRLLEAGELPPKRVVVIPPGVDDFFRVDAVWEGEAPAVMRRLGLSQDFILAIADRTPHDMEQLLEAYAQLPSEVRRENRLVLGGIDDTANLWRLARSKGLPDGEVVLIGEPNEDELALLYKKCKLFVLPAVEGRPVQAALNAMSCAAPVLGPDHAGIPELLGHPEALFEPGSVRGLSEKVCQVLQSPDFRSKLKLHAVEHARRFSWQVSASRCFEALESLCIVPSTNSVVRFLLSKKKPRMAYLSPLPPEHSGIADYSAELLPELAEYYEIDLITDLTEISEPPLQGQFHTVPFREYEKSARGYDRILYHIGNSPFHSQIPALLERHPGPVVLHDFFLSHLFKHLESLDGVSLTRNLYGSHGYPGLLTRARKGADAVVWTYPCNLGVLLQAAGIVVHSDHAKQLAHEWFGIPTDNWKVIPQLRKLPPKLDRQKARRTLGIPPGVFLVCSFGFLAPTKLNDLLFQSWVRSRLASLPNCSLVFAGGDGAGRPYDVNKGSGSDVRATGYLTKEQYELYLCAADVGVQLRGELSRGETPRSVFDCMAYGLPTIVSSHPALDEVPANALMKLSANCTGDELIDALERLYREPNLRDAMGRRAQDYVGLDRSPSLIAQQYAAAVEEFASDHPVAVTSTVTARLAELASAAPPSDNDFAAVASCIAENSKTGVRQLLVDVTVLRSLGDSKTGIHRTTRAVLAQLLENPPPGWRVEPVFRAHGETYRYARQLTCRYLQLSDLKLEDAPVAINPGDVFLGLDWDPGIAVDDQAASWLRHHHQRGLRTVFTIYDLLPLEHGEWFKPDMTPLFQDWLSRICGVADGFACISRTVADELMIWLDEHCSIAATRRFDIGYFHLGSDVEMSWASRGLKPEDQKLLDELKGREILLMIGTVEPRKGHRQALSAMEQLWAAGESLNLVICGVEGWLIEGLAKRLRSHPEYGRRLFWIEQATDETLLKLYSIASAALMASEGEGFGLPLVEAAQHGVPIIARDLPVFREVAGEHAFYFSGLQSTELANGLRSWLELYKRDEHPKSNQMPWLTWEQSTRQLLQVALGESECARWRESGDHQSESGDNSRGSEAPHTRSEETASQIRLPQPESRGRLSVAVGHSSTTTFTALPQDSLTEKDSSC